MNKHSPPEMQDSTNSQVRGAEIYQAIDAKAKMLVKVSVSLGIPLGNDGSPDLQEAIKLAQTKQVQPL